MAVSKTQNERPAIIDLIDLTSALELASNTHAQNIATLTEGLADEVADRETADTALSEAIAAEAQARSQAIEAEAQERSQAIADLQGQIGNGFSQTSVTDSLSATNAQVLALTEDVDALEQTSIPALQGFVNRFRLGATEQITVEAAGSYSSSLVYQTPFESADLTFVVLGFADDLPLTDLNINLIDSTYSGFSYSVSNTGSDDVDVRIGFLAVKVN